MISRSLPTAAVIIADAALRIVHAEGIAFDQRGYVAADWRGLSLAEILPPTSLARLEPRYRAALAGTQQSFEHRSADRRDTYAVQITPIRAADGEVTSVVAVMQDITEGRRVIEELARSEARLRESERLVGVGSWELSPQTGVITYSRGFARLMGLSATQDLDLQGFLKLVRDEDHEIVAAAIGECLSSGSAACELQLRGRATTLVVQGEAVWAVGERPTYLRGALLDVTESREAERERVAAVSLFRHAFDTTPIGMGLTDAEGLCYVRVNDAMCRLLGRSREQLMDESIDSITHPDDREAVDRGRQAMLDGTASSVEIEKRYLRADGSPLWTSLHVAPVPGEDGFVQAFFTQVVDITERKAREARFDREVSDGVWLGRIRDAIDDGRLVLYRQPIVDLRTGETVQQELLLRMVGEDGSIIAPGEFLPIAERYGLISEIDRWVLRQAVQLAARGEPTEFNLSATSIEDPEILRELEAAIQETGLDPSLLVLEVTETAMITQLDAGRHFATEVAALGCQLALDDFGTGFASLSYLKQIPAHHLKIDIEFVRDLVRSETDERLVRGIIGMAREFDQTTIAEGIEDEATLVRLRGLGVHRGQGYLFGRPEPLAGAAEVRASTTRTDPDTSACDPVSVVRAAFDAFARRDLDAMLGVCHANAVLRPHQDTSELTGRRAPYRGHEGIRAYFRDIAQAWTNLTLTPTAFRLANRSVIVFGHAETTSSQGATQTRDVLWVWQLRDGLVSSVEVFESTPPDQAPRVRPPAAAQQSTPVVRPGAGQRTSDAVIMALAEQFGDALCVGSNVKGEKVIDEALRAGVAPAAIHSLVIGPAMAHVGELWASGAIGVGDEHLATGISYGVLLRLVDALSVARPRSRELVLLAAVEGQRHVLGLRMVADILEGAGFEVLFLGADVPCDGLRRFVAERQPDVVGLGFGTTTGVGRLAEAIHAIHEVSSEPRIMLGGDGVPPGLRAADYPFVRDSLDVLKTVQQLLKAPPQALSRLLPTLVPPTAGAISPTPETTGADAVAQRLVEVVADSADLARSYQSQVRELRDLTLRDPVTGLANRRAFDDQIYLRTRTDRIDGALLMIDVDEFKLVNDTHGHEAGDRTLRLIGEAITGSMRPHDFAARIGGDEFAAILPGTGLESAREIGERVRREVASNADLAVTVSIGLAPLAGEARAALLAADAALYDAKSRGKDQVSSAPESALPK